jgi:DNA (cytosine-5)-methyltransferase 1
MRIIDLFCGCGGMSLGFERAGFDVVAAYDNNKHAIETYRKNFNHQAYIADLSDDQIIDELIALQPDGIVGGPPCQDFSIAGPRNYMGSRANLTQQFAKIVCGIKPKFFVMENVYNIERFPVLEKALTMFRLAGYGLTRGVFDASLMGVPQARKRFFLIGVFGKPDDLMSQSLNDGLSSKPMTVRDALGNSLKTDYYYMHPRSYNRRAIFSIDEPSSTIRGVNRPMPKNYNPHSADKTKVLKEVRALTSEERAYIQSFPKGFEFCGTKSQVEQQIGNAVPVKMAEYIAKHLIDAISDD